MQMQITLLAANITGEKLAYGQCDFEVGFKNKLAEPPYSVKGDIARTYFYMIEMHGTQVSSDALSLMGYWDRLDPVDVWECKRDQRIKASQGNSNHYVSDKCN